MAAQKKFDAVTILGILAAVGLFIGGQYYIAIQNRDRQIAIQAQKDKEKAEAAAKAEAELKAAEAAGKKPGETAIGEAPKGDGKEPAKSETPAAPKVEDKGDVIVTSLRLDLAFSQRGAVLKRASLPQEFVDPAKKDVKGLKLLDEIEAGRRAFAIETFEIGNLTETGLAERIWELSKNSGAFDGEGNWTLEYTTLVDGKYKLLKRFVIPKDSFYILADLEVTNTADAATYVYSLLGPAGILPESDPNAQGGAMIRAEMASRGASTSGNVKAPEIKQAFFEDTERDNEEKRSATGDEVIWGALKNRFFMTALVSLDATQLIKVRAVPIKHRAETTDALLKAPNIGIVGRRREFTLDKNASKTDRFALYLGPANEEQLNEAETAMGLASTPVYLSDAIQYCDLFYWRWPRVDWVARQMLKLFHGIYSLFGNYGVAVILMTLVIKFFLHPFQRRMMVTMTKYQKAMERMKPELDKIEAKYKGQTAPDTAQRLQREKLDYMMRNGASPTAPLAGCMPMFFQIPIFSALYGIFFHAFEIRGAEFLWIHDLAQPDHFLALPVWPHWLNLLPIIYIAMQFVQMKLTPMPTTNDPQQEMNRKMMMFMPLMFSILFYGMPSGLVLYFAAQSVFGMGETWYIRKYLVKDEDKPSTGKPPPAMVLAK